MKQKNTFKVKPKTKPSSLSANYLNFLNLILITKILGWQAIRQSVKILKWTPVFISVEGQCSMVHNLKNISLAVPKTFKIVYNQFLFCFLVFLCMVWKSFFVVDKRKPSVKGYDEKVENWFVNSFCHIPLHFFHPNRCLAVRWKCTFLTFELPTISCQS